MQQFFSIENLNSLHLELTHKCPLRCRRCERTFLATKGHPYAAAHRFLAEGSKINPEGKFLGNAELPFDSIKTLFTTINPKSIFISGNLGEPIFHSQFHEIVEFLLLHTNCLIEIHTSGSGRPEDWWLRFAKILRTVGKGNKIKRLKLTFSIDGLQNTNQIYRVNSSWNSIMAAVQAMRGTCTLNWKFILFCHNQNQVKQAFDMSKDIGFDEFVLIKSDRYGQWWDGADPINLPLKPTLDFEQIKEKMQSW